MKKQKSKVRKRSLAQAVSERQVILKSTPKRRVTHFFDKSGMHTTYRGILNGLHVLGYPFTHRVVTLDSNEGSVRQAFEDVGLLLDDAMTLEGNRIGSQVNARDEDQYFSAPGGTSWRHVAE